VNGIGPPPEWLIVAVVALFAVGTFFPATDFYAGTVGLGLMVWVVLRRVIAAHTKQSP
jgi:hypothetical protein